MTKKNANRSLHAAKATKQDEFYTQLSDIEKELAHYKKHFRGKTVLCNCDDPRVSNFFKYFLNNFQALKLKKLITTCYQNDKPDLFSQHKSDKGIYFEYSGEQSQRLPDPAKIKPHELNADGDFRGEECVNLLRRADIVVTNPPFSLFREYVTQLVESGKKFIILANQNTLSTKDVFEFVRDGKLWLGYNHGDMAFRVPDHYEARETRFWVDEHGDKWRSFDLPPDSSTKLMLVESAFQRRSGHEEAVHRRADHWVFAGGGRGDVGQGAGQEARL